MRLRIALERDRFAPGDEVKGEVVSAGRSKGVTARLRFVERTPGFEHVARELDAVTLTGGAVARGDALAFALELPQDALPSVRSRFGDLGWQLCVKSGRHRETLELPVA